MTDLKPELGYDGWLALLEPHGWAEITTVTSPGRPASLQFRIRLKADPAERDEWVQRANLLDQARRALRAVRDAGYWLPDAPRIDFGGKYLFKTGDPEPSWFAEADTSFTAMRS